MIANIDGAQRVTTPARNAREEGERIARDGGTIEDARHAGEACVPDSDRDLPGYGVRVASAGSAAVDGWLQSQPDYDPFGGASPAGDSDGPSHTGPWPYGDETED